MNARVNWGCIIHSNAKTLYTYFAVIAAVLHSYVLRVKWIKIELPMIISMYAASVTLKDTLKKWVLKCVRSTRPMPAVTNL